MFNNGVNYVFPDDIEVPSGQVKRFNGSVIDPKCLLKSESTYFCFDKKLFSSNNIFSCILLFLFWKYGLHAIKNGLVLINPSINTKFVKYCNLAYLLRFATRFHCHLNLTMSLEFFDLFALFLRHDLIIICSRRFL